MGVLYVHALGFSNLVLHLYILINIDVSSHGKKKFPAARQYVNPKFIFIGILINITFI